jgi:hypothetical protein
MHDPVAQVGRWQKSILNGYYQYHAVPGNLPVLKRFRRQVARYWFHALGQRRQRRPIWEKLGKLFDQWLPVPQVVHEHPDARFRRQSPSGGISKVRTVCGSAASTGLCGGWPVTAIPTATVTKINCFALHRSGDNGFPYDRLTLSELANSRRFNCRF